MKIYSKKALFYLKIFRNQNKKEKETVHNCFFTLELYANVTVFLFVSCLHIKEFSPVHNFPHIRLD